jgi:glycosyltransferase involved in cell wall biosynthesis
MSANTVSVIIPCYNAAKFLEEAIKSVLAQTYRQFEIILVNDGSTDNTEEVATRYPEVRYIYQKNQGIAAARNTGLVESCGEYVVFHNPDDIMRSNALEIGVNSLKAHPNCGFAFGLCKCVRNDGLAFDSSLEPQDTSLDIYQVLLRGRCFVPPSTVLFRHIVFEAVGNFDRTLVVSNDYDVFLRVARAFPGYCHNQVVVDYRQHSSNVSITGKPSRMLYYTLKSLGKQWKSVKGNQEYEAAFRSGKQHWISLFGSDMAYEVAANLKAQKFASAAQVMGLLLRYYPQGLVKYAIERWFKLWSKLLVTSSAS